MLAATICWLQFTDSHSENRKTVRCRRCNTMQLKQATTSLRANSAQMMAYRIIGCWCALYLVAGSGTLAHRTTNPHRHNDGTASQVIIGNSSTTIASNHVHEPQPQLNNNHRHQTHHNNLLNLQIYGPDDANIFGNNGNRWHNESVYLTKILLTSLNP